MFLYVGRGETDKPLGLKRVLHSIKVANPQEFQFRKVSGDHFHHLASYLQLPFRSAAGEQDWDENQERNQSSQ